jgi:hypothetical protein
MRKTVAKIKVEDVLLCYVNGISRWIGTLKVVGETFTSSEPIWSGAEYPERLHVEPIIILELETAIPAVELKGDMKLFETLKNPAQWSIYFRRSPSAISSEDANIVIAALEDAQQSPKFRPIPPSKLKLLLGTDGPGGVTEPTIEADEESPSEPDSTEDVVGTEHTEIQWRLLKLGSDMGMKVWAPKPDRNRVWNGHKPGEVSGILDDLPLQFDQNTMRTIQNIDVLWLQSQGHTIVGAFEIESSTSIYSGLLRLSDLVAMQPNLQIPLYIVAPDERREKVFREILRPTFDRREPPLRDYCQYIAFTSLREGYEHTVGMAKFLKPSFIETLAEPCEVLETA